MNKNKCFFLFLVLGASQAENRCVQEENCTLTVDNPGINTKSCEGYLMEECACVQRRSVNFEYDCHCCKNQTRPKRTVPLEAMFGLKTYVAPDDTPMLMVEPPANTHAPVIVTTTMEPAIQFQTLRKPNGLCGKLEFASSAYLKPGVATSISEINTVTIRTTHASTATNCWNLCRFNILSQNHTCTAIGFIEENSQKWINDCYILSKSPINSTGFDNTVDIYEICI